MIAPKIKHPIRVSDGGLLIVLAYRKLTKSEVEEAVAAYCSSKGGKLPKKGQRISFEWHGD